MGDGNNNNNSHNNTRHKLNSSRVSLGVCVLMSSRLGHHRPSVSCALALASREFRCGRLLSSGPVRAGQSGDFVSAQAGNLTANSRSCWS